MGENLCCTFAGLRRLSCLHLSSALARAFCLSPRTSSAGDRIQGARLHSTRGWWPRKRKPPATCPRCGRARVPPPPRAGDCSPSSGRSYPGPSATPNHAHAQIARPCGQGALQQLLSRIAPLSATAHLAGCGRPLPERLGHSQLALRSDSEICALSRKALAARCDALPPRRSLHTLASRTAHAHQLSQCPAPLRLHPRT